MKKVHALLLAPAALGVTLLAAFDAPAALNRNYDATSTCLRIDGVVSSRVGVTVVDNQTAAGTTSDATLKLQPHAAGTTMLAWMSSTLDGHASRKRVEVLEVTGGNVTNSETLDQPFIQEMELPALDGTTKDLARWTVRLSNTSSHATGTQPPITGALTSPAQSSTTAHFRVQIDGIDGSRIARVDPITVRTTLLPPPPPEPLRKEAPLVRRLPAPPTSTSTVSNLVLAVSPGGATLPDFQQWLGGDHAPRAGAIVFLAPNGQQSLCTVRMKNVVVSKITTTTPSPQVPNPTARVELTVGGLELACP